MFQIEQRNSGLIELVRRSKGKLDALVSRHFAIALTAALTEYAMGSLRPANLGDRFKPGAMGVYGFFRRSPKYEKRQMKINGGVTPYFSPRSRANIAKVATSAAKFAATPGVAGAQQVIKDLAQLAEQAKRKGQRMKAMVMRPGGFTIQTRGKRKIMTRITYPGARILNRAGPKSKVYRKEFSDLRMGNARDAKAILARAQEIYSRSFKAEIDRTPLAIRTAARVA